MANLEERCASLKSTIEQLKLALEKASATETELKSEMNLLQRNMIEITTSSQSNNEKLKQVKDSILHRLLAFLHKLLNTVLSSAAETALEYRKRA